MKKLLLLLSLILMTQTAYGYVDNQYMKTEQFLINIGYSADVAKQIAVTAQDPYREPYVESKKAKSLAKRALHYIIPAYENDLDFYNHSIKANKPDWKDY